jgi:hypothetical protein
VGKRYRVVVSVTEEIACGVQDRAGNPFVHQVDTVSQEQVLTVEDLARTPADFAATVLAPLVAVPVARAGVTLIEWASARMEAEQAKPS